MVGGERGDNGEGRVGGGGGNARKEGTEVEA